MTPILQMLFSIHDSLREVTPCALIIAGAAMRAYAPHYQLSIVERVKDHRMSAAEAERATDFFRWSVPTMLLLGAVLLGFALSNIFSGN